MRHLVAQVQRVAKEEATVLLTGDNMTVAADSLEALVVPIDIGIGRLELNVALRDRVPEAR